MAFVFERVRESREALSDHFVSRRTPEGPQRSAPPPGWDSLQDIGICTWPPCMLTEMVPKWWTWILRDWVAEDK